MNVKKDLLWYMSKEVLVQENTANTGGDAALVLHHNENLTRPVQQIFSFWAPLMQYNASLESSLLLHYPTFSTTTAVAEADILPVPPPPQRPFTAWQSLTTTNQHFLNHPPIVELL